VIEDCAHSLESVRDGVRPGALSDAACFSFYATKNLTSGEGGAIVTNDGELHDRLSWLRLHGMSKSAADRYTARYQHWDMIGLGYKANMNDLQAALLLSQMPRLGHQLERREAIGRRYEAAFREIESVGFPMIPARAKSARHLFTIWVQPERRDEILARLQERQIGVAVNYRAIHLLTYYRERFGFQEGDFPNAELIGSSTISLPMYPALEEEEVEAVIEGVRSVCEEVASTSSKADDKSESDHRPTYVSRL
jgi:UDP-4-amino-4-deoxy-L-arabinose-oxoglutarate aminotransferase